MLLFKAFSSEFLENHPNIRMERMNFNGFKQQVMPAVIAHDQALLDQAAQGRTEKTAKESIRDLMLAPNPNSPYPVFQTFEKSARFSLKELCRGLISLSDLDFALKSSSASADIGIEMFVMTFCRKGDPEHAA